MRIQRVGLLIVSILFSFFLVKSENIIVSPSFKSVEIINTLKDSKKSTLKDITYPLTLKNKSNNKEQLYISIINPNINTIEIHDLGKTVILGDAKKFNRRPFLHNNFVYPVLLEPNETRALTITIKKQSIPLNYKIIVSSENTFIKTTNHDNFFSGVFYGIVFMYLLILICFYIFSKSIFFLIYLAIHLFTIVLFLQYSGNGYQYIWGFSPFVQKYIAFIAIVGYFIAHFSFIRYFFGVRFKNTISGILVKIIILVILFLSFLYCYQIYRQIFQNYFSESNPYIIYSIFIAYGVMIIILATHVYSESGRREIIWVLIGASMHICAWILFINNEYGKIDIINQLDRFQLFNSNLHIAQLNYYIAILEMFVVSIFISINYHNLIRQNNISIKRLEFLQKRNINTFVVGQEEEREKITNSINTSISADIQKLKEKIIRFSNNSNELSTSNNLLKDIDKTLEDIHNITSNYVAPDMEKMKLSEIIVTATDKIFSSLQVNYDFNKLPDTLQLNAVANINIYRILQEISNNILKHSGASIVTISVIKDAKTLQIKISDNGIGFGNKVSKTIGIGMLNIESRVNSLNGNLYIISNERTGSVINIIIPLKELL